MAADSKPDVANISGKDRNDTGKTESNLSAMVARISSPHSLKRALNYNEKKLQKGQAECISAGNYLLNTKQMNFYDKLERLQNLISLNERAKKSNTLHISLNFDPSENLSKEKLAAIAADYIGQIGFGQQPYLVYQHFDAGHPHLHILTTNIQADGRRINTYNIGRNQSEKARKEIEEIYGLIKAQGRKQEQPNILTNAQRVNYGKSATKRAISNVLESVIDRFAYASLPELNAILRLYNVTAELNKHNGILYSALNANGSKTGVPIKASSFYMRPTLNNLSKKFPKNEARKKEYARSLRVAIDLAFLNNKNPSLETFINNLKREQVSVVLRQNSEAMIYGITFVDFRSKCVFNGSDLGKVYSAKMILERINHSGKRVIIDLAGEKKSVQQSEEALQNVQISKWQQMELKIPEIVQSSAGISDYIPYQLKKRKRKKKKQ